MKLVFQFPDTSTPQADLALGQSDDLDGFAEDVRDAALACPAGSAVRVALLPPVAPGVSIPRAFRRICEALIDLSNQDITVIFVISPPVRGHLLREIPAGLRTNPMEHHRDFQAGSLRVSILLGDLTRGRAEAIVNASNPDLKLGGGVSGAIRDAAGPGLQAELFALAARQPLADGDAVITRAHGMAKIRWIIHAASVHATPDVIAACIRNSLTLCARRRIREVAFPALGTGVGGLTMDHCATAFAQEILEHARTNALPDRIHIYLWVPEDWDVFVNIFEAERFILL
jgi:O-acetyl-ADP-ribose deacetylase